MGTMDSKRVLVRSIYMGKDGSCGYITGKEYEIYVTWYAHFSLMVYPKDTTTGARSVPYSNLATFMDNWPTITLIKTI